ncbi:hypothetical protein AB0M47_05140 [Hamadaea sp. NPDC051192]|uniref:hypothetical protein n=1 Tax=Hamadaea sp. NPDC051192 TaxID=3154940 RepID=UPI0034126C7F
MPEHGTLPAEQPSHPQTAGAHPAHDPGLTGPPDPDQASLSRVPAIPVQLAVRPTLGGLAVPWTTARTPDGRYRFGSIDFNRHRQALTDRLCQICGRPLGDRTVFALRHSDLQTLTSHEPGMHPVCAAYTAAACPMVAGRMHHYGALPSLAAALADLGITVHGDPAGARAGTPAEPWHLLWTTGYYVFTQPRTQTLAVIVPAELVLRVRPVAAASAATNACARGDMSHPGRSSVAMQAPDVDLAATGTGRPAFATPAMPHAGTAEPTGTAAPAGDASPPSTGTARVGGSASAHRPARVAASSGNADGHRRAVA